jgi:hypothetical protein
LISIRAPTPLAERRVIEAVRERITDASSLQHVLKRVEAEVRRLAAHVPEDLKLKRAALASPQRAALLGSSQAPANSSAARPGETTRLSIAPRSLITSPRPKQMMTPYPRPCILG